MKWTKKRSLIIKKNCGQLKSEKNETKNKAKLEIKKKIKNLKSIFTRRKFKRANRDRIPITSSWLQDAVHCYKMLITFTLILFVI